MKGFLCSILFLLCFVRPAGAGEKVGNGGKVILCPPGLNQPTAELVDFYEARVLRNWYLEMNFPAATPVEMAKQVLSQISQINPTRYKRYSEYLNNFMNEALFTTRQELVLTPDSNHPVFPVGCEVKQLAIQSEPTTGQGHRYLINGDIWKTLDLPTQTGLILHEIIYREQILAGVETSQNARLVNSIFSMGQLKNVNQAQYLEMLEDLVPDIDFDGYNFAICRPAMIKGIYSPCATRQPPQVQRSSSREVWTVKGFISPPWSPWGPSEKQYFEVIDPTTKESTRLLVYGPYSKGEYGFSISPVSSSFDDIGVWQFSYAGHKINLTTNQWYTGQIAENDLDCYKNWNCQSRGPANQDLPVEKLEWVQVHLNLQKEIGNLSADPIEVRPGTGLVACAGSVSFFENGVVRRCERAFGQYENSIVKVVLDNSIVQLKESGALEFAQSLQNSYYKFQGRWIAVGLVMLQVGYPIVDVFQSAEDTLVISNGDSPIVLHGKVGVTVSDKGEIVSIKSQNPFQIKFGEKILSLRTYLRDANFYMSGDFRYPPGLSSVSLASAQTLSDTQGKERLYLPKWGLQVNGKGQVYECLNSVQVACY